MTFPVLYSNMDVYFSPLCSFSENFTQVITSTTWYDSYDSSAVQLGNIPICSSQVRTVLLANKKFSKHKYYTTFEDGYQENLNPEFQKNPAIVLFSRPIQRFSLIKLHVTKTRSSLNKVCEGVAGAKNHTKKFCWPLVYFASKIALLF